MKFLTDGYVESKQAPEVSRKDTSITLFWNSSIPLRNLIINIQFVPSQSELQCGEVHYDWETPPPPMPYISQSDPGPVTHSLAYFKGLL